MRRLAIFLIIIFFKLNSYALAELTGISYTELDYNKYKVTLTISKQVDFKINQLENNKISIELNNSKFSLKSSGNNKLDSSFVKALRKSAKNNKLKIILELANNAKFYKNYTLAKNGKLYISIELQNDRLPPIKKPESDKFIIMIDPGHGGSDSGAIGSNPKILEKDITLKFAKELYSELAKYPDYEVILSRSDDLNLSLEARKQKAKERKANIFISLHVDSNPDTKMQGACVYTLSKQALDDETSALAERENKTDILKNDQLLKQNQEIANVLIDMVYHDTKNSSVKLAEIIAEELSKEIKMLDKYHRSAGFKVLKGVDIPAVLIEIGYLSNSQEEQLLTSYVYKKKFAQALIKAINKYIPN